MEKIEIFIISINILNLDIIILNTCKPMEFLSLKEIELKYDIEFNNDDIELENIIIEIFNNKMNLENYDLTNSNILNIIGDYYYLVEINYPQAIKYCLMAIELGNSHAMNNLAMYYYNIEKNYPQAIKYYLMAIELGNSYAMNNLAVYYHDIEKNYPQAIKYFLMAIEFGNFNSMNNLLLLNEYSPIEVFVLVDLVENPNELIENLKIKLKENSKVITFENKKKIAIETNNINECLICYETKLNIKLDCGHMICVDCYPKINSCYLRCK